MSVKNYYRKDPDFYNDNVNHPSHYTQGNIECFDAMLESFGPQAVKEHCLLCAFKYIWRHNEKGNRLQDIRKARWYIDKYIWIEEVYEPEHDIMEENDG